MKHDDIYDRVARYAAQQLTIIKSTGEIGFIHFRNTETNQTTTFTLGLVNTPLKYDLVVESKRSDDVVKEVIRGVVKALIGKRAKSDIKQVMDLTVSGGGVNSAMHWNYLRAQTDMSKTIAFPNIADPKEFGPLFNNAQVKVIAADYDAINHDMKGLLHAVYMGRTNLVKLKLLRLND